MANSAAPQNPTFFSNANQFQIMNGHFMAAGRDCHLNNNTSIATSSQSGMDATPVDSLHDFNEQIMFLNDGYWREREVLQWILDINRNLVNEDTPELKKLLDRCSKAAYLCILRAVYKAKAGDSPDELTTLIMLHMTIEKVHQYSETLHGRKWFCIWRRCPSETSKWIQFLQDYVKSPMPSPVQESQGIMPESPPLGHED
ncbi:hypothetical protein PQX77_008367 [Marasmius sp. AFHP31]|nr:hypothetical protein PQX77_008367 [Marasmius sp. AFHP31]